MSSFGNFKSGQKKVTTAGTAVAIAASTPCSRVLITALPGNTGVVMVGGSTVSAVAGSEQGIALAKAATEPNFVIELYQENLANIWIDAATSGDGVAFAYEY